MTDTVLVDILGMVAGAVWLCAALYFQMIRPQRVHPGFVAALSLIGVALVMGSSAVALRSPGIGEVLAVVANVIFIVLGLGVSVVLEHHVKLQDAKDVDTSGPPSAKRS